MKAVFKIFLGLWMVIFYSFIPNNKKFPEIDYYTLDKKHITNTFFNGKKTMVIMGYLGCPAAMVLLKDIEALNTDSIQVLVVLENTLQQVVDFNATDKNTWSELRTYFKMQPISGNVIAECKKETITKDGDNIILGQQCRKLSRKIITKSSPTIVMVDENGKIYKNLKGYFGDIEQSERIRKLKEEMGVVVFDED